MYLILAGLFKALTSHQMPCSESYLADHRPLLPHHYYLSDPARTWRGDAEGVKLRSPEEARRAPKKQTDRERNSIGHLCMCVVDRTVRTEVWW